MHASLGMPALQPITRTTIAHDPDQSRWFPAKFAGTCAWTGLPFWAGERVMRYHGAYVAARTISLLCFTGLAEGGSWSDFERAPADPLSIPDRTVEGDRLWLVSTDGTMRAFMCKGGKFEGGKVGQLGWGSPKSRAQLGALLRGTVAFRIDRMGETPVEALLREQGQ